MSNGDPPASLAEPVDIAGPLRRIYAYRTADGRVPALEGLEALDRKAQTRYATRFREMATAGQLRGQYHHPWKGKDTKGMSAFKDNQSQTRIPAFADGAGDLILTHVITGKKENEIPNSEVSQALRCRDDYLERKAELMQNNRATGRVRGRR